jgi:hypothetical protein
LGFGQRWPASGLVAMPCAHFDAPLAGIVSHNRSPHDHMNPALRLRLPDRVLLVLPRSSNLRLILITYPCKIQFRLNMNLVEFIINRNLRDKRLQTMITLTRLSAVLIGTLSGYFTIRTSPKILLSGLLDSIILNSNFSIRDLLTLQIKTGNFAPHVGRCTLGRIQINTCTKVDFRNEMPSAISCALTADDNQLKACHEARLRFVHREMAA